MHRSPRDETFHVRGNRLDAKRFRCCRRQFGHFIKFGHRRLGWSNTILAHAFEVHGDRRSDTRAHLLAGRSRRNTAWQVGHVSAKRLRGFTLFDNHEIIHESLTPDCFSTLFKVPIGISSPSPPEIVTRPGRSGCLNWRCPVRDFTVAHPAASILRMISRTFMGASSRHRVAFILRVRMGVKGVPPRKCASPCPRPPDLQSARLHRQARVRASLRDTVWCDACMSWFITESGKIRHIGPGSPSHISAEPAKSTSGTVGTKRQGVVPFRAIRRPHEFTG